MEGLNYLWPAKKNSMLRQTWWKILSILLLAYTIIWGFIGPVPAKPIVNETIRNLYFHVAMWFAMMIFLSVSVVYAVRYLRRPDPVYDIYSLEYAKVGIVFGTLGIITGSEWAGYTWGAFWSNDPKQLGAMVAMLIYYAYLVFRNGIPDIDKRARLGAVYNIFAFAMLFPTIWILPRMVESLHPGGMGGNPAFNDLDPRMAMVWLCGAIPGWSLLGAWIATLRIRLALLAEKKYNNI
jgi:heme exporter protein C